MPTKQSSAEHPRANTKKASRELERAIASLGKAGTGTGATTNNFFAAQAEKGSRPGMGMHLAAAINA